MHHQPSATELEAALPAVRARRPAIDVRRWGAPLVWWLAPLLGLMGVLAASSGSLAEPRFAANNDLLPPLRAGERVGQQFVARYPGLAGVAVGVGTFRGEPGPARASLVLHLRAAPTPGPDLATARLPAGQALDVNPWYTFTFPPIADSQDRTFYFEIESPDGAPGQALTLAAWDGAGGADAYPFGSSYRNGVPHPGDLAFGLRYSAAPPALWSRTVQAAFTTFPPVGLGLLALLAAGGLAFLLWLGTADPGARRRRVLRAALPLALGVALAHGLLYWGLVPPWQGPDEPSHFGYVALLDRHNLDVDAVTRLDPAGAGRDTALIAAVSASMNRYRFTHFQPGSPLYGAPVDAGPAVYGAREQGPAYYWLAAAVLRGARALGAPVDPVTQPENTLWLLRALSLALTLGVVALAWVAGIWLGGRRRPWLRLGLPLTIALVPMHAFVGAIAGNNGLAALLVAALFVALVALLRRPTGWGAAGWAGLAVGCTLAGVPTKQTALITGLPLLAVGGVLWLGLWAGRRWGTRRVLGAGAALGLLGAGAALLAVEPQARAESWRLNRWVVEPAPQVAVPDAHHGASVIALGPGLPQGAIAEQVLLAPFYHPPLTLTVSGWVRLPPEAGASVAAPTARLILEEAGARVGRTVVAVEAAGVWTPISLTHPLAAGSNPILVQLKSADAPIQFDDFAVQFTDVAGAWANPVVQPALRNPSFEALAWGLRPPLAQVLPLPARQIVDTVLNPQAFDKGALWRQYAVQQNDSFWSGFGWGTPMLPAGLYHLIAALVGLAGAGLLLGAWRRRGCWGVRAWVGVLALGAFGLALVVEFTSQMMLLAVRDNPAAPQGRYLFPLIIPLVWLLLEGWREVGVGIAAAIRGARRRLRPRGPAPAFRPAGAGVWAVWLGLNALVGLAAYCLLALVVPFYWGWALP